MKNKKRNRYLFLLVILLVLTIGYALLSTKLKINGTTIISKNIWNVYWDNVQVAEGSKGTDIPVIEADTGDQANTKVTWSFSFDLPGDFYEFTVDAVNNGTIDAMITNISNVVSPVLEDYISYTVTYADGSPIENNDLLAKKVNGTATRETYKIRVEYLSTITPEDMEDIPAGGLNYTITYGITYSQATSAANAITANIFSTDSWDTLIELYNSGNTKGLERALIAGTTREVQLDMDHDGTAETTAHVRIINLSKPAECSTQGFSQTACGFVIEFVETIAETHMNSWDSWCISDDCINGESTKGGWEYSNMRAFVNGRKYKESSNDEIDYTGVGVYDALPVDLKDKIIDTTVVSGHGNKDSSNFTTTDKLYLLDVKEVYGAYCDDENDCMFTAGINERQLDYYKKIGVTTKNYSLAIKKDLNGTNSAWWLRSAADDGNEYEDYFWQVSYDEYEDENYYWQGALQEYDCFYDFGVSPAFRIAE